ncbi:MAG: TolC family protein [Crocinitomicaceae bacterium]|nr:TolC family protein [Crocinitomicaceae bacterium]
MKPVISIICLITIAATISAQQREAHTLEKCYELARKNYPMVKLQDLIQKTTEYSVENALRSRLPQVSIVGQASYQTDVTSIPFHLPGISIPELNKDQYKLYADASQVIYDGGAIGAEKKLAETSGQIEKQKLEVELYQLRQRVSQLYFGIIAIREQLKQNEIFQNDIELGMKKIEAAIANGTATKNDYSQLKIELLKRGQHEIELRSLLKNYIDTLKLFIKAEINEDDEFQVPGTLLSSTEVLRPELKLYESQRKSLEVKNDMVLARNRPKFSLFFQGGYGRPALNMLSNDFNPFAIGGIRMNWSLSGFYTRKKDIELLDIQKKTIDLQNETFLFNTTLQLHQKESETDKLRKLIRSDQEIIDLYSGIKTIASTQLENGTITSNDYLREINAENIAKQNLILHEIQLKMVQYDQLITSGN